MEADDVPPDPLTPAFGADGAVAIAWEIPADCDGKTAEDALAYRVRRLGVERARRVVAGGDMRVQGRPLSPGERVKRGTVVELWRVAPDRPDDAMPTPRIIHQDDALVVVDKPGDLAVHPSARYLHRTLTGWLRRSGFQANPCHRLDRETSGVLVCAVPGPAEAKLKGAFAAARVEKEYLAVVRGALRAPVVVDAPLALQGERGLVRIRMIVDPSGQSARTEIEPIRVVEGADGAVRSLVRCRPLTGRQHQIRAHLAHVGHPIVGDKLYAMGDAWFDAFTRRALTDAERASLDAPRQALHAARLTLKDDGRTFVAPLPADLAELT